MRAKRGKRKAVPAIVPRFLKGAVTMGVIPALAGGCEKPKRVQPPVVAYFAPPSPEDAMRPPPPVVAAYQRDLQPVVAAYAVDASIAPPPVDAAPDAARKVKTDPVRPPPPVVAAMVPRDPGPPIGPAVVAAYVPRDRTPIGSGSGSAAPKKPKKK